MWEKRGEREGEREIIGAKTDYSIFSIATLWIIHPVNWFSPHANIDEITREQFIDVQYTTIINI